MTKLQEIRDLTVEELEVKIIDTKRELFQLVESAKREKKLEKPHRIRQHKRDIARMLTVLNEKKKEQVKE